MTPIENSRGPLTLPSPLEGEGWGEGRSLEIGVRNLFGICNLEFDGVASV